MGVATSHTCIRSDTKTSTLKIIGNTILVVLLQNLTFIQCITCRFFGSICEMCRQFLSENSFKGNPTPVFFFPPVYFYKRAPVFNLWLNDNIRLYHRPLNPCVLTDKAFVGANRSKILLHWLKDKPDWWRRRHSPVADAVGWGADNTASTSGARRGSWKGWSLPPSAGRCSLWV